MHIPEILHGRPGYASKDSDLNRYCETKYMTNDMFQGSTVGFIGSGVMGEAMIGALINRKVVEPQQIVTSDVLESRGQDLEKRYGIRWTTDNCYVARHADFLVLSIKPQVL